MFRETSCIRVFGTFSRYWEQKVIIFVDVLLKKTRHAHQGYHTRKSQKACKIMYGESSVKVCHLHELWVVFWIFHIIRTKYPILLIKISSYSYQLFYFLLFYISFYIRRCHFSELIRISFNIIRKKIFVTNFPFLTD